MNSGIRVKWSVSSAYSSMFGKLCLTWLLEVAGLTKPALELDIRPIGAYWAIEPVCTLPPDLAMILSSPTDLVGDLLLILSLDLSDAFPVRSITFGLKSVWALSSWLFLGVGGISSSMICGFSFMNFITSFHFRLAYGSFVGSLDPEFGEWSNRPKGLLTLFWESGLWSRTLASAMFISMNLEISWVLKVYSFWPEFICFFISDISWKDFSMFTSCNRYPVGSESPSLCMSNWRSASIFLACSILLIFLTSLVFWD